MVSASFGNNLPMLVVFAIALLGVVVIIVRPWWIERGRARLRSKPFPTAWRSILRRRVPIVARMPTELQLRLKRHIQVFLAGKPLIGCQGQVITDEVCVTIAAQACMLLLGHPRSSYFPRLQQILVYPDAFVVRRERQLGNGLVRKQPQVMAGESWAAGQLILSWAEVVAGAADPADGSNVVLHEFAHQIDQDKGVADGRPWRPNPMLRRCWAAVMDEALARMQREPSALIDAYGASDPAEFFAVVTEVFFERPQELAAQAPAVYRELSDLYCLHPSEW